jgi:hypothetical protein
MQRFKKEIKCYEVQSHYRYGDQKIAAWGIELQLHTL